MYKDLCRGKTTPKSDFTEFNNIWVEGDLIHSRERCYIHPLANIVRVNGELGKIIVMHEIVPSTLGWYTGKNDKNGIMVFEGDIVRVKKFNDDPIIGKIVFNENTAGFEVWWNIVVGAYGEKATRKENFAVCGQMEVIGNIYDTPELLK